MSSKRPGVIYGIRVRRSLNSPFTVKSGYIGQTRQRPWSKRIEQHKKDQSWGHLVVEAYVLWESDNVSDLWLDFMERWFIYTRFPVHNDQHNRNNPRRKVAEKVKKSQLAIAAAQTKKSAPSQQSAPAPALAGQVSVFALCALAVLMLAGLKLVGIV